MPLFSIITNTPLGEFSMLLERNVDGADVVVASGFSTPLELKQRLPEHLRHEEIKKLSSRHAYSDHIAAYFASDTHALGKIRIKQVGSVFEKKVWKALQGIRWGKWASYKDIAEKVGSPSAYRAVGSACAANRHVLIVPCHRVLRSGGGIGEYIHGEHAKKFLLELERK